MNMLVHTWLNDKTRRYVRVDELSWLLTSGCSRTEVGEVYRRVLFAWPGLRLKRTMIDEILSGDNDSTVVADAILAAKPGYFTCVEV